MLTRFNWLSTTPFLLAVDLAACAKPIDFDWHTPEKTAVNNLNHVINGTGVNGFIFNSSQTPVGVPYTTYNYCNAPHVRRQEYHVPPEEYRLAYVEVIHRHHKRTPYSSNTFPIETQPWNCDDSALYYYGAPYPSGNKSAATFWRVQDSSINPFKAPAFPGNCEFPQITHDGLDDSWQHGKDLYGVYHDLMQLIPDSPAAVVSFRVTNNVITSEVAGMLINGMFGTTDPQQVFIEREGIDSLEPQYPCEAASKLYSSYGIGSTNPAWTAHLKESQPLYETLDHISGVNPSDPSWHVSWDHYFDNLSSRLCHQKPLPCNDSLPTKNRCVTTAQANKVFRLGEYEYSFVYRDASDSLKASVASFGIWVAQLAQNLRSVRDGSTGIVYRHNVAHDGSMSRLLSILQIDRMVWPGLGSEVVFELFSKDQSKKWFVRVLWGGKVLESSNPTLGTMDMVPLNTLLSYFDGLVGEQASKIQGLCSI